MGFGTHSKSATELALELDPHRQIDEMKHKIVDLEAGFVALASQVEQGEGDAQTALELVNQVRQLVVDLKDLRTVGLHDQIAALRKEFADAFNHLEARIGIGDGPMQQRIPNWQYKVVSIPITSTASNADSDSDAERYLNNPGNDDWELVSVIGEPGGRRQAFFKKPKG